MLYLDNAATSIKKPFRVYSSMIYNTLFCSANAGRGGHRLSLKNMEKVIETQELIAELLNIREPQNIAFTPNATYALNMAIAGTLADGGHVVVTQMDHNSVLRPVHRLGNYSVAKADKAGYVSAAAVEKEIRPDTKLVVCTHASNVCGTIMNVEEIGRVAKKHGAKFLIDAAQTAGCVNIDAEKMHADFIAFSGHKGLMGPLGTGGLYVRNPSLLKSVISGGTGSNSESLDQPHEMPDMLHSGTLNTPAIAALGAAVRFILKEGVRAIGERERYLALRLDEMLGNTKGIRCYGGKNKTGISAFNIGTLTSAEAEERIGNSVALRSGYHCAPLAHKALGTEDTGIVRVSFGAFDSLNTVQKVYKKVAMATQ